ncbi:MAG: 5-oxoprolinase subunit B family protein, partial [Pseudomonadales bacterium]
MQLQIASENTLLLTLGEEASPQVSALVQSAALATKRVMGKELIDLIPSYASLLIIYDPFLTDHFAVTRKIKFAMESLDAAQAEEGTAVILPVYYSPESGEDLEDLAERANMSIEEVIALHSGSDYRVYAIGFAPGFAYLGEVHERIA